MGLNIETIKANGVICNVEVGSSGLGGNGLVTYKRRRVVKVAKVMGPNIEAMKANGAACNVEVGRQWLGGNGLVTYKRRRVIKIVDSVKPCDDSVCQTSEKVCMVMGPNIETMKGNGVACNVEVGSSRFGGNGLATYKRRRVVKVAEGAKPCDD
ncbi:hypothetical protein Salat_1413200 [Sesamum alatum]|uniref:Uncharacterized protein n=1 Tax=Sesamum alatum TaxID=300844 RepID=A0AAE1YA04_9LAMI|nr:hypothetical protein Salat_1413200 [Sesamum alatum]